jgi:hypothetical protein
MSSYKPPKETEHKLEKGQFETLTRLLVDRSSKAALWIMAISTLVLALPIIWQVLKWVVYVSKK